MAPDPGPELEFHHCLTMDLDYDADVDLADLARMLLIFDAPVVEGGEGR